MTVYPSTLLPSRGHWMAGGTFTRPRILQLPGWDAVVVFLLSTRAQGHLINSELLSNRYFTTPSIPKCVAWGHPNWDYLSFNKSCLDGLRPHTWYGDGPRPHTSNRWPQATHFKLMAPGHTLSVDTPRPHTSNRWPQATYFNLMAPAHTLSVDGPRPHTWCYMGLLKVYVAWGHPFEVCGLEPSTETMRSRSISNKVCGLGPSTRIKCMAWGHQLTRGPENNNI